MELPDSSASRRTSHNSRLMRDIVDRLRDYTLDEVQLICEKYRRRHGKPTMSGRFTNTKEAGETASAATPPAPAATVRSAEAPAADISPAPGPGAASDAANPAPDSSAAPDDAVEPDGAVEIDGEMLIIELPGGPSSPPPAPGPVDENQPPERV